MARGMDHGHYAYEADGFRPVLCWPRGAAIAVWVVLHLEYSELYPPHGALQDSRYTGEFGNFDPDYRSYSRREYGNRIGLFRILDVLAEFGAPATVATNSLVVQKRSSLAATCLAEGHEICAHGVAATRMISSRMSEADERIFIEQAKTAVARCTGSSTAGWIAQDFGESARTPQLVAQAGFSWLGDWPNDDQPYFMATDPPIVSIPYHSEWDDANVIEARKLPVWKWQDWVTEAFDRLHTEGGRVFSLGLHPWVIGHPHRIRYLRRVLSHITGADGVWMARGTEIATAFRGTHTGRS